jgi:asparagine synthase (glutamine-hydrolysing)
VSRLFASRDGLTLLDGIPGVATGPHHHAGLEATGEVTLHNGPELRARLNAPDCPDTELLLRAYAASGIAEANGMFALVIKDGADLVLVRDHVGARTLFYARANDGWLVSTSLRTLRDKMSTRLHLPAVRSFLTFAYLPGEETLLEGIREVLPGRLMRLHPNGSTTVETFWEPQEDIEELPAEEHARRLRTLLEKATARRLPAAEPVGVLLSGGIDSSLVTALATKLHDHEVLSYSISFGGPTPNELAYSSLVATHCHTRHRVLTVPAETIATRLAETVALLDSPVGDPLTVPNLLLAEAVVYDGLRIVYNGEGGDPVFGGPKNLPMLIFELHRDHSESRATAYLNSYRKCYSDLPVLLTTDALAELESAPQLENLVSPYLQRGPMGTLLNQLLHCNLRTKGAHHILTKVERLTSANGLLGLAPLFDRDVIDQAFRIPPRFKLAGTQEKWILKEAVRDLLPSTIVDRPKSGMRVPVQQWLRGPLRDLTHDVLLSSRRGLFRQDTIKAWLRGEGALLPRQGGKIWQLLTLELWLRAYDL